MGTDIHAVFQKKTNEGWEDIETDYKIERYYFLFAWLGYVLNEYGIVPVAALRGLPDDFAIVHGKHNNKRIGPFGRSWLTSEEIIAAPLPTVPVSSDNRQEVFDTMWGWLREVIGNFVVEIQKLQDEHGEVRMVFGFGS